MSLPTLIPSQDLPLGRMNPDGTVTVDLNWYLWLYNLASQVFSNANGAIVATPSDIAQLAQNFVISTDALQDKQSISNLHVLQGVIPQTQDTKAIINALLMALSGNLVPPNPQAENLSGVVSPVHGGTGVANDAASTVTISGAYGTTLTVSAATSLTLPTSGTLATLAGSEALTNKTISGAFNTLSNIGNGSLTNSSITVAGHAVSLGGSTAIAASDLSNGVTGSGFVVLASNASLVTPALGTPSTLVGTNITGTGSGFTAGDVVHNVHNWTPALNGATTTTYIKQTGTWVKIGSLVTVTFWLNVNSIGDGSTQYIAMTGLPTPAAGQRFFGNLSYFDGLATSVITCNPWVDSSGIIVFSGLSAAATAITDGQAIFGNNARVLGGVTYFV